MCTVLLPPRVNPIAVKYTSYHINRVTHYVRSARDVRATSTQKKKIIF